MQKIRGQKKSLEVTGKKGTTIQESCASSAMDVAELKDI